MNFDYTLFIPEYLLAALAASVVALDLFVPNIKKSWLSYIAAAGLAIIAGVSLAWVNKQTNFAGIIAIDNYTTYFRVFFIGIAAVICLASGRLVDKYGPAETPKPSRDRTPALQDLPRWVADLDAEVAAQK